MDNNQKTQKSINEELQYLWENRQTLNNEQWNRLALIVCNTLKHIKFYDFEGFTTQEDLIQDFFEKKVYRPDLNSKCYHTGALILFFKNFLKDKLPKKIEYDEKVRSYEVMIENGEKNIYRNNGCNFGRSICDKHFCRSPVSFVCYREIGHFIR